ncbi:hypothetical protein Tco_1151078, partial [Tanacetum coccineum]
MRGAEKKCFTCSNSTCRANEADMHPVVLLIKRGMEQFPGLKAQDRHAVVDRVFEMKVKDMLKLISHLDTLQQVLTPVSTDMLGRIFDGFRNLSIRSKVYQ